MREAEASLRTATGEARRSDSRRPLAAASVLAVLLLGGAALGTIWRYELALGHSDEALSARANTLAAQRASTFFWRERETMNEYLLRPSRQLLAEITAEQRSFDQATNALAAGKAERSLVVLSRRANAEFVATFGRNRQVAGLGPRVALPAVKRLDDAEASVFQPLNAIQGILLREVARRRTASSTTGSEALAAAILGALIAIAATGSLAFYCRRLLGDMAARRGADQKANASQNEFTAMLQSAEAEEEADELLKRQLERSIPTSSALVLRRNNSADRLQATTAPAGVAEQLACVEPRACLAVRFGRTHEEGQQHEPLIRCVICSQHAGYSTCQPLLVGGEVIGSTLVRHDEPLTTSERAAIVGAVAQAGPVLANLRNLALARFRAATDALTGLPNSREVQDTLKRMSAHAARTLSPLTALLLDLDHFKQINDSHGHALGDDVLAALGTTVRAALRASDFVGRYGGEEFVILLPDTGREEGAIVAEKIRHAVATITVSRVTRPITASIGLATFPDDAGDSVALLRSADRALYVAKSNGRNRVEVSNRAADPESGSYIVASSPG